MFFNIIRFLFHKKVMFIVVAFCLVFTNCSDDKQDVANKDDKKDLYIFTSNADKFAIEIKENGNEIQIPIINETTKNNILDGRNDAKILAIFPQDCSMCIPTLIHLSNLASRTRGLKVVVLSQSMINTKVYKDFLPQSSPRFPNLIASNKDFEFFIDSVKRALNIEIKDFKSPLFLLIDNNNNVVRSYEGAILEEIFEKDVSEILSSVQLEDSDINKEQKQ